MNAKTMLVFAACAAASLAMADGLVPSVSNVAMAQTANSRNVTITYDLADAAAVVTLDVQTNRTGAATNDDVDWVSLGGANVCYATGDVWKKVETGSRTITWRADRSWRGFKVSAARAVVKAWSVDNPPDYMVVNLAANATKNSETYYPAVEFLPGGLLSNSIYRTSQLVMRKIPARGVTWEMGSMSSENSFGRDGTSEELHTVTLSNNYYIAVFATTQAQWAFVQKSCEWPSYYTADRLMRPVEKVSYNEIRNAANATTADTSHDYPKDPNSGSFLGLLRAKTGLAFDLPSEAQWEFACRAGHGTGYWGDGSSILSGGDDANLDKLGRYMYNGGKTLDGNGTPSNEPAASCGVTNGTAIVGSYAPNSWGLYDMHGNVWEWCLDWYEADVTAFGGAVNVDPSAPSKTLSGAAGSTRVLRGGGWNVGVGRCRSARRSNDAPSGRANYFGFRLALPACPAIKAE